MDPKAKLSLESEDEVFHKTLSTSVMYSAEGGEPQLMSPNSRNPNALSKALLKRFESVDNFVSQRQGSMVGQLKERLTHVSKELEQTQVEKEQLASELEGSRGKWKSLEDECQVLKKLVDEKTKGTAGLENQLKIVKKELDSTKKRSDKNVKDSSDLNEKLKYSEQKVMRMTKLVEEEQKAREDLVKQLDKRSSAEVEHKQLYKELEEQKATVVNLNKELVDIKRLEEQAMGNLEKEQRTTADLKTKFSDMEMELKEAKDKAVQRQGDITLIQEQYEDNKRKLQREVKVLRETLQEREEELKQQKLQSNNNDSDLQRSLEYQNLLEENQTCKQLLRDIQTDKVKVESGLKDLLKEKKKQTLRLQEQENTTETLRKENKSLKKQVALIAKQCNQLKQQLKEGAITDRSHQHHNGNAQAVQLTSELPEPNHSESDHPNYTNLQQEHAKLREDLTVIERERTELHKQLAQMTENHCQEMNKQNKKIASQLRYIESMQQDNASGEHIL